MEESIMFEQVFENLRKTSDSAIAMQQEMFNKWVSLWPGVPAVPSAFGEPVKFQKKWAEVVGDLMKKRRETLESQFSAGLGNIEEAFHLPEARNPEELRTKTVALWQKMFDCLRQTYEAQARDFQTAVAKCAELMTKEPAAPKG